MTRKWQLQFYWLVGLGHLQNVLVKISCYVPALIVIGQNIYFLRKIRQWGENNETATLAMF